MESRKIRKGTSSCWECKRRKVRCRFETDVCENCKRRKTKCVDQTFSEPVTDPLSHTLLAAWPSQHDMSIILDQGDPAVLHHGAISPEPLTSQLPPNSSPIQITKKLLLLASYLQSLPHSSNDIQSSAIQAAHQVTSQDDLLLSTDGIECLMIETMYHNNAGDLRKAWHLINRAIILAQLLNLPRTEHMWFRLIQMNRYLSLMLGMLQGTPNNDFADPDILQKCSPVEQMQRLSCVAGGQILQRNEAGLFEISTTKLIDQLLKDAAALLPESWWTIPQTENLENILRVRDQLTYFHLVAQLHLPHLLCTKHKEDSSTNATINASREVLIRFIAIQKAHSFTSFCRGISFLAFIGCTTLCIARMENLTNDCNIIQSALEAIELLSEKDTIASRISPILRILFAMSSKTIKAQVIDHPGRGMGCGGKIINDQVVEIFVPYAGTIRFEQAR